MVNGRSDDGDCNGESKSQKFSLKSLTLVGFNDCIFMNERNSLNLPVNVVKVPKFGADTILRDVDVRMIVSLARPPDRAPDPPRCHPEPGGPSWCPDVVLVCGHILVSVKVHLAQGELEGGRFWLRIKLKFQIWVDQSEILSMQNSIQWTWLMSPSSGYTRNEV